MDNDASWVVQLSTSVTVLGWTSPPRADNEPCFCVCICICICICACICISICIFVFELSTSMTIPEAEWRQWLWTFPPSVDNEPSWVVDNCRIRDVMIIGLCCTCIVPIFHRHPKLLSNLGFWQNQTTFSEDVGIVKKAGKEGVLYEEASRNMRRKNRVRWGWEDAPISPWVS